MYLMGLSYFVIYYNDTTIRFCSNGFCCWCMSGMIDGSLLAVWVSILRWAVLRRRERMVEMAETIRRGGSIRSQSHINTNDDATANRSACGAYTCEAGYAAMMDWYAAGLVNSAVPYESITVPTRYGDTHLLAAGPTDAPPVVLLHGMEGTGLSWEPQTAVLHTAFRVYALDIMGSCGKSAPVRLSHENAAYAEWLEDVMTELRLERASFVGISNGSWRVMKFATQAPERIEKAVLMSVNGLVPVRFPYRLARYVERDAVRTVVEGVTGRVLTRDLVRLWASLFVVPRGVQPDPQELEWFYLLAKYYRYRFPPGPVGDDDLRMLAAPTLVMMGQHEHFFDIHAAIGRARRLLPDLRAGEIIPGVGHNMATDNPDLVNARIMRFLQHTR